MLEICRWSVGIFASPITSLAILTSGVFTPVAGTNLAGGAGSVNYASGQVSLTFGTAPASAAAITVEYRYDNELNARIPEVQLDILREYCRIMGWEIYQEYVDHASALDVLGRFAWQRLIQAASRHLFDILLVWKLDRAFRSVRHAANTLEQLRGYKIQFKSYTEGFMDTTAPHGEFIFHILAATAGLERQMIGQRVRAGMNHARKHGTKSGRAIGRPRKRVKDADIEQHQ